MSLTNPHPLWTTCNGNPFETSKAILQAKFLSGRYRCDSLLRHFDKTLDGNCSLCRDSDGSIEHLLLLCPSLSECRDQQFLMLDNNPHISDKAKELIYSAFVKSTHDFIQILLDCSVVSEVIELYQNSDKKILEDIFKFSRTWCYNVHKKRMKMLGRWTINPAYRTLFETTMYKICMYKLICYVPNILSKLKLLVI